ncbi:hypothetical protein [Sinorhizobium meliloti]|uniref:hypothetical protein n=1 Tax=Rhizobium meliloti TaxID=382 RepID=UPI000FD88E31|nr:hypothetical protein [Sinorhizobium meliloti]RVG89299.1 hypothetical protein CN219_02345 [Sinorhizobium meliloti]RVI33952.1 hypothetical protein CN197_16900 [Sinorhizobium meliloti]RVI45060.1 hypothetical protein CN196_13925 [Sinorhizobium meliloti]RVJ30171.1 hypothetical protein CN177_03740 [Sinorhizobium meliloti]RVK03076.1 hypothetical protein CN170_05415 [Sinorhizobium meliloti]
MMGSENPAARACANRVPNIKALGGVDVQNPTENPLDVQSESLAILSVMRRCRVSFWHAKTICQLSGLGGQIA